MSAINSDLTVIGQFTATKGVNLQPGAVQDANVAIGANIAATKTQHQYNDTYAQGSATTAFAETRAIHVVYGSQSGQLSIAAFKVTSLVACIGGASITVDLKSNGTSLLSAPIVLTMYSSARSFTAATIISPTLTAGQIVEVVVTVSVGGGTLGQGLVAELVTLESAN